MPARNLRLLLLLVLATLFGAYWLLRPAARPPIRIGAIHAQTGFMAASEKNLIDALQLAVEEINASGGLLGRRVELIVADSRSDRAHAAGEAERLISAQGVSALFACWTTSCRLAVRPVVERHQHLMFYALQYEGLEESPNLIYLGAAPNQQIIPGARWAMDRFGKRVYLLGSDYLFSRAANLLISDLALSSGGEIVGERYRPMQTSDFSTIIDEIRANHPDVILNTLNGSANQHFFAALANAKLHNIPVVSFSIAEPEAQAIGQKHFHPQHFAVWGYFQSLPSAVNEEFISKFRARYGAERVVSDPVLSSYNAVHLWATAVREAETDDPAQVNRSILRVSLPSPAGIAAINIASRHLWRRVYVGQARADGQFVSEELSEAPVRPTPFPPYRSRAEWLARVNSLNMQIGQ